MQVRSLPRLAPASLPVARLSVTECESRGIARFAGLTPLTGLRKLRRPTPGDLCPAMNLHSASHRRFATFADFYPYYLAEHRNVICRRLHFIGTALLIILAVVVLVTARWSLLVGLPLVGYGFAWLGHFVFEKNRPATFLHPWYSLLGDFVMFRDMLVGRIRF